MFERDTVLDSVASSGFRRLAVMLSEKLAPLRIKHGRSRQLLRYGLFPASMLLFIGGGLTLFDYFEGEQVALFVFFATIPLFFLLEHMLPWQEDWLRSHKDVRTDVLMLVMSALLGPVSDYILRFSLLIFAGWLGVQYGVGLWPSEWPLLTQGILAVVVGDFFRYWFHRLSHEHELLWRLHATHHSSTRLYFFNGIRIHPVESILTGIIEALPFVLLGAPPEALALKFLIGRVIGRFQHCNLDVAMGPFDYIFSSPKNHRWHHSKDPREGNNNYGGDTVLWDHVFGTFYLPKDREPTPDIGVGGVRDFPQDFVGLMLSPFRWSQYQPPSSDAPEQGQGQDIAT